MANENIFRFMSVRPANLKSKQDASQKKILLFSKTGDKSDLYKSLEEARNQNVDKETIVAIAKKFKENSSYVKVISELKFNLDPLIKWMEANRNNQLEDIDLSNDLMKLYANELAKIVESSDFIDSYSGLADTILIDNIVRVSVARRENIVLAFKLLNLLKRAKDDAKTMQNTEKLGAFITHSIVVLPDLTNLKNAKPATKVKSNSQGTEGAKLDERKQEVTRLKARLKELETAHRELSRLASDRSAIFRPKRDPALLARIASMERRISELSLRCRSGEKMEQEESLSPSRPLLEAFSESRTSMTQNEFLLSLDAFQTLSEASQKILHDLKLEPKRINPIQAVGLIEEEIGYISSLIPSEKKLTKLLMLGGILVDLAKFKKSLGKVERIIDAPPPPPPPPNADIDVIPEPADIEVQLGCDFQAGIGDLLMVKQELKAYELAEFAHVENVLAGETRERTHRRLNLREDITVFETERETEEERDLQSTERNELQNEAEKTISSQLNLEAGLQISGSYGPSLTFSSSLNAGYSTSTEETQRKATSYSKEVTEKTAERIRERVREERRRRLVEEIEEINKHTVKNEDPSKGHIRGIYRWLNKIYDAQVLNYGQRMMFEFIVPEPAAYFLYALVENPPEGMEIDKPVAPTFPLDSEDSDPLQPKHLTRTNYHEYVSKYRVTNAPVPPIQWQVVSAFEKLEGTEEHKATHVGRSRMIVLPDGYEAMSATVQSDSIGPNSDNRHITVLIGGQVFRNDGTGSETLFELFNTPREKEISVAIEVLHPYSFAIAIDVWCRLTSIGFAKWQHDMYDAIMNAYLQQKADFDEKQAAMAIQQGGMPALGRNPLENRRLEREELKKLVLTMLSKVAIIWPADFPAFDSFYKDVDEQDADKPVEPIMDVRATCEAGEYIRFFEHVFEWNNMLYVFYSYFWGRKVKWTTALHLTDPDPDFAAFLKAGAARVQVPVRPGFERAIAYFCQSGQLPQGNDISLFEDDLYVPIVDEITENLGKLDEGVPYPEGSQPWEVTVPTSLVFLQNLEEIQGIPSPNGIRDKLTGNKPNLLNTNA